MSFNSRPSKIASLHTYEVKRLIRLVLIIDSTASIWIEMIKKACLSTADCKSNNKSSWTELQRWSWIYGLARPGKYTLTNGPATRSVLYADFDVLILRNIGYKSFWSTIHAEKYRLKIVDIDLRSAESNLELTSSKVNSVLDRDPNLPILTSVLSRPLKIIKYTVLCFETIINSLRILYSVFWKKNLEIQIFWR